MLLVSLILFFFFNDTATTEIYTLSLHDALPISRPRPCPPCGAGAHGRRRGPSPLPVGGRSVPADGADLGGLRRSEEHTSELQSRQYLVCRLLLEKKKKHRTHLHSPTLQFLLLRS